ncbi:MAG: hypothetical protein ACFFD4_07930 [Candidatus Odinarchaeota archaeon]
MKEKLDKDQLERKIAAGIENYDILIDDLLQRLTRAYNNRAELKKQQEQLAELESISS